MTPEASGERWLVVNAKAAVVAAGAGVAAAAFAAGALVLTFISLHDPKALLKRQEPIKLAPTKVAAVDPFSSGPIHLPTPLPPAVDRLPPEWPATVNLSDEVRAQAGLDAAIVQLRAIYAGREREADLTLVDTLGVRQSAMRDDPPVLRDSEMTCCGGSKFRVTIISPIDELIHQFDRATAPQPLRQCLAVEHSACFARERADHLQRQALARPAVPAGTNAAWGEPIGGALRCPAVDRLLARAVSLQHLAHEHRQRNRWRIQPLAVLGQHRLGRLKQLRTGQHVEELHRLGCPRPACDSVPTLMQSAAGITIHGGWPSERWFGSFVHNHPIDPWVSHLPLSSNSCAYARDFNTIEPK